MLIDAAQSLCDMTGSRIDQFSMGRWNGLVYERLEEFE